MSIDQDELSHQLAKTSFSSQSHGSDHQEMAVHGSTGRMYCAPCK